MVDQDSTVTMESSSSSSSEEDEIFVDCLEEQKEDEDDDDDNNRDSFELLPDELALRILSFLSLNDVATRLSLVSRRFRHLCRDASLWTVLQLPLEKRLGLTGAHEVLERCSTRLRQLSLKCRTDSNFLAMYAVQHCPKLERLEMVSCEKPTRLVMETIGEYGGSLRSLNLWMTGVEAEVLEDNVRCLRNLTHLDLFNCKGLRDCGLKAIADHVKGLEYFNMEEVTNLTDEAMNYFLAGVSSSIKHLLIDGESLTDESFKNLKLCSSLESLGIIFADELRGKGMDSIAKLSRLHTLKVRRGKLLVGQDFVGAFRGRQLSKLTHLDLSECAGLDDMGLQVIASNCPELVQLSLDWCWDLTDDSVRCVLLRCGRLRRLQLMGIVKLTSAALRDVTVLLPELDVLDLQQCPDIDDDHLQEIASAKQELELTNYYGVKVLPGQNSM